VYAVFAIVTYMVKHAITYTDAEVLMALRKRIEGLSIRKAGTALGVSGAYIHDLIHHRRGISANIAEQLGFALVPQEPRKWIRTTNAVK
jgi:plasmid maintenance system antidote protein VapI